MKTMYIGHWRDGSGYGQAAQDYLLSMREVGLDVCARPFRLNNNAWEVDARVEELEKTDSSDCSVIIQHTLPHHMRYNGNFKNVGLFASETSQFRGSTWPSRLKQMDELWVPNYQMTLALRDSGVDKPTKIIPHAVDTSWFRRSYEPIQIPEIRDTFVFYFIGELNVRKNLIALLKAFHTEFRRNEPVSLVLKVNKPNTTEEECTNQTLQICQNVKEGLKLKRAKREIIISQRLTTEQMMQLHSTCNCLVAPSYGEACHIPSLYALGFGNTPIITDIYGGFEHINGANGFVVKSEPTPVFAMNEGTFSDLYLGTENWDSISIPELKWCMRKVYEDTQLRRIMAKQGMNDVYKYDHKAIGEQIKEALCQ